MSRVDEFAGTSLITRIEWIDGQGATWGEDFVVDPNDSTRWYSEVTGTANQEAVVEVTHADGTSRVYKIAVGQRVIWDSQRGTYSFPR